MVTDQKNAEDFQYQMNQSGFLTFHTIEIDINSFWCNVVFLRLIERQTYQMWSEKDQWKMFPFIQTPLYA